jgi:hypothetical protein
VTTRLAQAVRIARHVEGSLNRCQERRSIVFRTGIQIIVVLLTLLGMTEVALAKRSKTLCVNIDGSNGCFSSVEAAVSTISRTAVTISIEAGFYVENITLNKGQRVTLEGVGAQPQDVTLDGNNSGSVITVAAGASLTVETLTIADGNALQGGAINSAGNLTLESVRILENFSTAEGGGIFQTGPGKLLVSLSEINANSGGNGGGIFLDSDGIIDRSSFVFNQATNGGGLLVNSGSLALTNTLLFDNSADLGDGGGLNVMNGRVAGFNDSFSANQTTDDGAAISVEAGSVKLDDATIIGNQSFGTGGGIFNPSNPTGITLENSLLVNQADSFPDCNGFLISNGFNLIGDSSGCTISGNTTGNATGVDPLIDVVACLTTNGLAVPCVQTVSAGSPATHAGDPEKPNKKGKGGKCVPLDALGTRRHAGACDAGAFQLP